MNGLAKYPTLKPFAGFVFEAYMTSSKPVGLGTRELIVWKVGHKWVNLFYVPSIVTFKMSIGQFHSLFMRAACQGHEHIKDNLRERMALYAAHGWRYSKSVAETVLGLELDCGAQHFEAALIEQGDAKP